MDIDANRLPPARILRITASQNVDRIEENLKILQETTSIDLLLGKNLKDWQIGGQAALMQFFITWSKKCPNARLRTFINPSDRAEIQINELIRKPFGLVAFLMAPEVLRLKGEESLKKVAYPAAARQIAEMSKGLDEIGGGTKVFLLCVDHSTKWTLPHLYYPNGEVRGRSEFSELAHLILRRTAPKHQIHSLYQKGVGKLGTILFELFQNTHDWARQGLTGVPPRRSVRAVLVEQHNASIQEMKNHAYGDALLQEYIGSEVIKSQNGRQMFLEISVIDSGDGLAKRWLAREWTNDLTVDAETEACIQCLQKWSSSTHRYPRGLGLFTVVRMLSQLQGFLRIRSGRVRLSRDFIKQPALKDEEKAGVAFSESCHFDRKISARVEGTLFTLLIPLKGYLE